MHWRVLVPPVLWFRPNNFGVCRNQKIVYISVYFRYRFSKTFDNAGTQRCACCVLKLLSYALNTFGILLSEQATSGSQDKPSVGPEALVVQVPLSWNPNPRSYHAWNLQQWRSPQGLPAVLRVFGWT